MHQLFSFWLSYLKKTKQHIRSMRVKADINNFYLKSLSNKKDSIRINKKKGHLVYLLLFSLSF
jgi:hypothetical protein